MVAGAGGGHAGAKAMADELHIERAGEKTRTQKHSDHHHSTSSLAILDTSVYKSALQTMQYFIA